VTTRNLRLALPVEFGAQARDIIIKARFHGLDPVEALNYRDLLLTPLHENRIQVEVLRRFADELLRWQPHEMLRRKYRAEEGRTPADMYHVIQEFLDEFIQHRKDNPL
jgi:hypothetical protein